jgi:hypothetical protein
MLGIIIAALLGSVTAIGLFFVARPYLLRSEPAPSHALEKNSERNPPAGVVRDEPARQNAERKPAEEESGETAASLPESVRNQSQPTEDQSPAVASTEEPDPTDEPFPGLNAKLNQVIPLASENKTEDIPEPIPEPVVQNPKPDGDAMAKATRQIDGAFLSQIRAAKTREEKLALVNVLKKAAQAEAEGSATRLVLLERAHQVAVDAPDRVLTDELVSVITAEFDVEPFDYHLFAVEEWDRMRMPDMEPPAEHQFHRLLARKAAILGDLAYERKDFKTAATMYALVAKRRDRADDKVISDLFDKKRTAARTKETRHALATTLLKSLEQTPDDAGKNLEAGLACVQTGLWDEGLACLSKGSDESLKNFATEQLKLRADSGALLQAGDRSWDAVRQLGRRHAVWLKELAVADYEAVLTELTALQLQRVKQRIGQVGPVSCVRPVQIQHFAFESDDFAVIKKANVLRNRMGHFCNGQLYGPKTLALGIRGSSVELNGRGGMVVCPQTQHLIPGDSPFTISLWINTDRSQEAVIAGRMYRHSPSVKPDFLLRMLASGHCETMLAPESGGVISARSHEQVARGHWVHLAMTWNLDSLKLYLDGRETASLSVTTAYSQRILANRAWIAIGGEYPANSKNRSARFAGRVDEFRIYDRALSPLQIFHVFLEDQTPDD